MTIKHIVISGGGLSGLIAYGAAKHLHNIGFWNINNIKSMYGTSVGAIVCVGLALKYDFDYLDDYLIKRPWDKVFEKVKIENILNIYRTKGLFTETTFSLKMFDMLLEAKGLSTNITLLEFFQYNHIELHFFTTELNSFSKVDLSYKTHPNLSLIQALNMSSAFPLMFKPIIKNNECFIDGGIITNYPLNECLKHEKCNKNEILGFKNTSCSNEPIPINEDSSLIDYIKKITNSILIHVAKEKKSMNIPNEICCNIDKCGDYSEWFDVFRTKEKRTFLINSGVEDAKLFLEYRQKMIDLGEIIHNSDISDSDSNSNESDIIHIKDSHNLFNSCDSLVHLDTNSDEDPINKIITIDSPNP